MESNSWQSLPLGECATFSSGGTPSKKRGDFWAGDIPWVSAKDLKLLRLHDSEDHVTSDAIKAGSRIAPTGSIFLLVRGMTLHKDVPICLAKRDMAFNQDVKAILPKPGVDGEFLLYWLLGNKPSLLATVDSAGHGTGRLNTDRLKLMEVRLPPVAEQKRIAHILGTLDDKIELNRRMNATLEAMARALFENWMEQSAGELESRNVEDLIADGILLIGDGYRAKNSEMADDGLPFVRAGNLKADGLDLAGAESLGARGVDAARHKVGREGDVCFTSKGTVGRITRVCSKTGSFVYSPQVCFWRTISPQHLNPHVLYQWMKHGDFMRQVNLVSTQTDMAPYVSLQDQRKMVIELPPKEKQVEIARDLEPIDARIAANAQEVRILANLRDTLLPKLLSENLASRRVLTTTI